MFDPFTLGMIGAGIGAFTNKKDPLTGAVIGGGLGYGGGLLGGAGSTSPLSAGGVLNGAGTNALAGGNVAQGLAMNGSALAGSSAMPTSAGAFEASMGLPSSALISSGAPMASAFPIGANAGMVAGQSGNLVNFENFIGAGTPFETFTGGEGTLANAMGNFSTNLPDYVTPKNVLGAANILAMSQPRQMPMGGGGGGVRQGNPQGLNNLNYGMAQVIPRKRGLL